MILDGHIHITEFKSDPAAFRKRLAAGGIDGGIVISLPPPAFRPGWDTGKPAHRLDNLFAFCGDEPDLFPFYWLDPLEENSAGQIKDAVNRGAAGFKMICDRYRVSDKRAMDACRLISGYNLPILFHSGILWDGKQSSQYNHPVEFEALLTIKGLRFCLAHISWPWCDELVAVYGKFLNASVDGFGVEMFVDTTPGTPPVYREEVLTRLFKSGYDARRNVIFGTDCFAHDYNAEWTREWIKRDKIIFDKIELSGETVDGVFGNNLGRFLGMEKQ